jgi:hypothetical protein
MNKIHADFLATLFAESDFAASHTDPLMVTAPKPTAEAKPAAKTEKRLMQK